MKILCCIKQVPEKDARLRVGAGDGWIVEEGLSFAISECDRYGVEAALRLKEKAGGEAVVLSVGPERVSKAIKEALAMGCERAIHVVTDDLKRSDPVSIGRVIAAAIAEESFDVVICGQQSDDLGYNAVGPAVAQALGMHHVSIVLSLEPTDGGLRVTHELDNNLLETIDVPTPLVLGVQSGINDVRYASLKGIMQAGAKPQKKLALSELGGDASALEPKVQIESVAFPVRTKQATMIEGDAKAAAQALVEKLKTEAKVL
jgi:electron transfer flavoprotein beta subunit